MRSLFRALTWVLLVCALASGSALPVDIYPAQPSGLRIIYIDSINVARPTILAQQTFTDSDPTSGSGSFTVPTGTDLLLLFIDGYIADDTDLSSVSYGGSSLSIVDLAPYVVAGSWTTGSEWTQVVEI